MDAAIAQLAARGFDLTHAFDLAVLAGDDAFTPITSERERRLGVLVGNTRALWPVFTAAVRADERLATAADPLDRYTERVLGEVFPEAPIAFAHRRYGHGHFMPMQRLAELAGFAARAATGLSVHETYGPWFALRGVIALVGVPPHTVPAQLPCAATTCARTCTPALARAMSAKADADAWRAWLAVRDACTVGREHRYDEDQLRYHYTKDRSVLR